VFGRPIRQCGKEAFYFKCRGHKSQTQEIDQRGGEEGGGKKPEPGGEKGQTKEPTRRLQEKPASTFKTSGPEDEKKVELKKS